MSSAKFQICRCQEILHEFIFPADQTNLFHFKNSTFIYPERKLYLKVNHFLTKVHFSCRYHPISAPYTRIFLIPFPDFGHDKRKCQKCQSVNIVFMIAAL